MSDDERVQKLGQFLAVGLAEPLDERVRLILLRVATPQRGPLNAEDARVAREVLEEAGQWPGW